MSVTLRSMLSIHGVEGRGQAAKDGVRIIPWLRRGLQIIRSIKPDLRASREITAGGPWGAGGERWSPFPGSRRRFLAVSVGRGVAAWCAAQRPWTSVFWHAHVWLLRATGTTKEVETAPDPWGLPRGPGTLSWTLRALWARPVSAARGRRACSFPARSISGGPEAEARGCKQCGAWRH
ncbi:hypothetical protein NDU88_002200 [Pleurodeles waltl]|uniref:Uncharacterized protein n=1 Tax=Pleurodeles waltl TaxID=8319 RepID=A0AAV7SDN2_PLEWA|nr:hypothetical protein NDU88_002200 [Pleurodeles waltl]